jgi:hypothetical protein
VTLPAAGERLGWWPSFYKAWHQASQAERDAAYQATRDYRAGLIDGAQEVAEVAADLQVAIPYP